MDSVLTELRDDLQRYYGVDLTTLSPDKVAGSGWSCLWETWTRPPMGLKPSPYQTAQGALVAKRVALLGDPASSAGNIFWQHFSVVSLGLKPAWESDLMDRYFLDLRTAVGWIHRR
jgi:hypothetical protein